MQLPVIMKYVNITDINRERRLKLLSTGALTMRHQKLRSMVTGSPLKFYIFSRVVTIASCTKEQCNLIKGKVVTAKNKQKRMT